MLRCDTNFNSTLRTTHISHDTFHLSFCSGSQLYQCPQSCTHLTLMSGSSLCRERQSRNVLRRKQPPQGLQVGPCELEENDENEQTSWETEMEDDGHVDHVSIAELKMQEMTNETDADGNDTNDLPEFLPSTVGKVKDTGTEEELVEVIEVIDQEENQATIKNLIVSRYKF